MTQDYKYSRSKTRKPLPGWLWLITGFALGLVVAFFVYLNGQRALKELRQSEPRLSQRLEARDMQAPQQAASPEKRKFDFYTLLPELEVIVPDGGPPERDPQPARQRPDNQAGQKTAVPVQPSTGYLLQAGSFHKLQEADSLKARLALLGVESRIQTVRVDQGTWHRVRVGPYRNRQQANRVRAKLKKNHIDTLLLMAKQ